MQAHAHTRTSPTHSTHSHGFARPPHARILRQWAILTQALTQLRTSSLSTTLPNTHYTHNYLLLAQHAYVRAHADMDASATQKIHTVPEKDEEGIGKSVAEHIAHGV